MIQALRKKLAALQIRMIQDSLPSIMAEAKEKWGVAKQELVSLGHMVCSSLEKRQCFSKSLNDAFDTLGSVLAGRATSSGKCYPPDVQLYAARNFWAFSICFMRQGTCEPFLFACHANRDWCRSFSKLVFLSSNRTGGKLIADNHERFETFGAAILASKLSNIMDTGAGNHVTLVLDNGQEARGEILRSRKAKNGNVTMLTIKPAECGDAVVRYFTAAETTTAGGPSMACGQAVGDVATCFRDDGAEVTALSAYIDVLAYSRPRARCVRCSSSGSIWLTLRLAIVCPPPCVWVVL